MHKKLTAGLLAAVAVAGLQTAPAQADTGTAFKQGAINGAWRFLGWGSSDIVDTPNSDINKAVGVITAVGTIAMITTLYARAIGEGLKYGILPANRSYAPSALVQAFSTNY